MEVNEEKRQKFIEHAGKRVNNVMHDMQILEPMSRSSSYDFTKSDLEEMFAAMQDCLNSTKEEFYKKFEEKVAKNTRKTFSFGVVPVMDECTNENQVQNNTTNFENIDANQSSNINLD